MLLSTLSVFMVVSGLVLAGLAGYVAARRGAPAGFSLAVLLCSVAWWGLAYALELSADQAATAERWGDLKYVGVVTLAPAWLVYVLQYTGRGRWVTGGAIALLAVEPLVVLGILFNEATHDLVRFYPPGSATQALPVVGTGPVFWVHFVYANVLLIGATLMFVVTMVRLSRTYRLMALVLVGAALLPWIANLLHNFEVGWFTRVDLTPFAFIVTGGVLVWGLFQERLVRISPLARSALVKIMPDGLLVVDAFGRVADANPACSAIFGRRRSDLVGTPVTDLLPSDSSAASPSTLAPAAPGRRTRDGAELRVGAGEEPRIFDLRWEELTDRAGGHAGEVVVLRDVTERVRAEDRLRALLSERSRIAAALQASLVPGVPPRMPGCALATCYRPAGDGTEIGGDFYDLFRLDADTWGLVIGDVSGKGAEAAAITALTRYTLRTLASAEEPPSRTLAELNTRLLAETTVEQYCTLVYAVARRRPRSLEVTLALAGHYPPLLYRRGGRPEQVGELGTALGLVPDPELHDRHTLLAEGDSLWLFTDGLAEARHGPELFGPERAAAVLDRSADRPLDERMAALVEEVHRFRGGRLDDDLAVLAVEVAPVGPEPSGAGEPARAAAQARS